MKSCILDRFCRVRARVEYHRLDRDLTDRFGSNSYAMEEIVEFCAGFLCADLGISAQPREDHAHNVANGLDLLKNDRAAVFTAAAAASKAAEFLHSLQSPAVAEGRRIKWDGCDGTLARASILGRADACR